MRIPFLHGRRARNAELDEEIRSHLVMAVRDRVARGEEPESARRAVIREFGNVVLIQEVTRAQWRGARLERAARELKQTVRGLWRARAFTLTAVLVLGLGIGLATALFTVVDTVLLRPLPLPAPERVVLLRTQDPGGVDVGMSQDELKQLGSANRTLAGVAGVAHQGASTSTLLDGERALTLRGAWVTGNFFELLGVRPLLGHFFSGRDETPGGTMPSVLVLSYETWHDQFGADSSVIGRPLGNPYTQQSSSIIGVAPPGLAFPAGTEYWTPLVYSILNAVARLAPGASPEAARTEFLATLQQLDARREAPLTLRSATVRTLPDGMLGDVRPQLLVLGCAVALLLLIACVNVGNLVLLRASERGTEVAVRRALGARAFDVVRPLLLESAVLAVAGGLLGLGVARGLLMLLIGMAPPELPRLDVLRLSAAPLELAAVVTVISLLLSGLLPVLAVWRDNVAAPLRLDGRAGNASRARHRTRQILVASQVALALMMLAGAGLLLRSLDHLTRIRLGYRADHLSILTLAEPVNGDDVQAQFIALFDRVAPALQNEAGVASLTPIVADPFYGPQVFTGRWMPAGQPAAEANANPMIPWEVGGSDYFRTMEIPLLRGRGFRETDSEKAPRVAVVSQAIAERFWPGEDPVGKQFRSVWDTAANPWITVVGEAGDIRYRSLREATPTIYFPFRQLFFQGVVAVRTSGSLESMLPALRRAVRIAAPEATLTRAESVDALVRKQFAVPRLSTVLLTGFGLSALLLAAIGLYGVMSAAVRERTRELGIRAALGAQPGQLRKQVLVQAGAIAGAGAVAGLAGALAASHWLRSLLFEVRATDPAALLGAGALLLAVALLAAWIPAWRATRADPLRALRAD